VWLILGSILTVSFPALVSTRTMSGFIGNDYRAAIAIFGRKAELDGDLVKVYQTNLSAIAVFANGFRDKHDDSANYRGNGDAIGEAIAYIPEEWAGAVKLQAYSFALRLVILCFWGPWVVVPLSMGAVAGLLGRKLKFETFSPPVPPIYNSSAHLLLAIGASVVIWLLCPLPIPIMAIPAATFLVSGVMGLAIANYPQY
jgi:Domain of unknown function (DUF4400)